MQEGKFIRKELQIVIERRKLLEKEIKVMNKYIRLKSSCGNVKTQNEQVRRIIWKSDGNKNEEINKSWYLTMRFMAGRVLLLQYSHSFTSSSRMLLADASCRRCLMTQNERQKKERKRIQVINSFHIILWLHHKKLLNLLLQCELMYKTTVPSVCAMLCCVISAKYHNEIPRFVGKMHFLFLTWI